MFKLKSGFAPALIKETIQQNRQKRYDLQNNAQISSLRFTVLELFGSKIFGGFAGWDKTNRIFGRIQS